MKSRKNFYVKKWLNPDSTAFIYASIEKHGDWGTLKLADCTRIVDFDIMLETPKERRATIKKLNIMLDTISDLRDAIEVLNEE